MNLRQAFFILLSLFALLNSFALAKAANASCDATITITDNQVTIKLAGIADKETSYQIRRAADASGNGYVTEDEARNGIGNLKAVFGFDLEKQNFLKVNGLIVKIDSKSDESPNFPGEVLSTNPVTFISQYATDPNVVSGYFTSGKHSITFNFKTAGKVGFTLMLPSGIDESSITYSKGTQDTNDKKKISGELARDEPLTIGFGGAAQSSTSPLTEPAPKKKISGFELPLAALTLACAAYLSKKTPL